MGKLSRVPALVCFLVAMVLFATSIPTWLGQAGLLEQPGVQEIYSALMKMAGGAALFVIGTGLGKLADSYS